MMVYLLRILLFSMLPLRMPLHLGNQLEKNCFLVKTDIKMHLE